MLKVITGGMYSGKSSELLRQFERNKFANKKALLFNSHLDQRYSKDGSVTTHDLKKQKTIVIEDLKDLEKALKENDTKKLYFDEVQFYNKDIIFKIIDLVELEGYDITVAGLDLTFDNFPFANLKELMPYADTIQKTKAVCVNCGADATKSHRVSDQHGTILVGSDGDYIALCRSCFVVANN